MKVDIVGGSLGGLSTAITIKKHNPKIKVVLHEKHKQIGYNPDGRRCGEGYAVYKELKNWQPVGKSIFNVIEKTEYIVGNKTYMLSKPDTDAISYTVMLNRQEFIAQLGKQAIELGVEVHTDDKIRSVDDLDGDYIADASGCPSLIKRELGFKRGIKGITYQQTLEDSNFFESNTFKLFFGDSIGYYWIFPRNPEKKEINLGIGLIGNKKYKPKKMLELFKEKKGIEGNINYTTGGVIPVGLQKPLMYKNILFVGDAGVGTFPFTAEGIYRALLSGETAGRCIATGKAKQYPSETNAMFVRWDLIGRTFLYMGKLPQKMGDKVFLKSIKYFFELVYFPLISKI